VGTFPAVTDQGFAAKMIEVAQGDDARRNAAREPDCSAAADSLIRLN
jgi:hypothetical protein